MAYLGNDPWIRMFRRRDVPTNRYPARCARCGKRVAVGVGELTGKLDRWSVVHIDDPICAGAVQP